MFLSWTLTILLFSVILLNFIVMMVQKVSEFVKFIKRRRRRIDSNKKYKIEILQPEKPKVVDVTKIVDKSLSENSVYPLVVDPVVKKPMYHFKSYKS